MKDTLFAVPVTPAGFAFNEAVASVFNDMIRRSVPGYELTLSMIGLVAQEHAQEGSRIYDLGCSLGGASLAIRHAVEGRDCNIVGVDNSEAMLQRCRENLSVDDATTPVDLVCADVCDIDIGDASLVVLNFTLQFIPRSQRLELIRRIHRGLRPGGVLLLSEKISFDDPAEEHAQVSLHHAFKRAQGYSELEISQKRTALENVLLPETLETHRRRLDRAGFPRVFPWFQCFNFVSIVAFK